MDIYILTIAVIYVIIRLFIDILQISFINNHKITNDEIEKLEINVKDYDIAKSYNLSKLYLSLGRLLIDASLIYTFLMMDGLLFLTEYISDTYMFLPYHFMILIILKRLVM